MDCPKGTLLSNVYVLLNIVTVRFSQQSCVAVDWFVILGGVGVPHLREGDVPPQGGKPGWAAPPSPRIGPWLKLLKRIAESRGLVPEFEVYLHYSQRHGGSLFSLFPYCFYYDYRYQLIYN